MLKELLRVSRGFGIGVRAQLVQIQSLALSLRRDAISDEPVQNPVSAVGERKYEAEERRDAHKLSQNLIGPVARKSREQPRRQQSPQSRHAVHGNRSARVVDTQAQLEPFDTDRNQSAGDD